MDVRLRLLLLFGAVGLTVAAAITGLDRRSSAADFGEFRPVDVTEAKPVENALPAAEPEAASPEEVAPPVEFQVAPPPKTPSAAELFCRQPPSRVVYDVIVKPTRQVLESLPAAIAAPDGWGRTRAAAGPSSKDGRATAGLMDDEDGEVEVVLEEQATASTLVTDEAVGLTADEATGHVQLSELEDKGLVMDDGLQPSDGLDLVSARAVASIDATSSESAEDAADFEGAVIDASVAEDPSALPKFNIFTPVVAVAPLPAPEASIDVAEVIDSRRVAELFRDPVDKSVSLPEAPAPLIAPNQIVIPAEIESLTPELEPLPELRRTQLGEAYSTLNRPLTSIGVTAGLHGASPRNLAAEVQRVAQPRHIAGNSWPQPCINRYPEPFCHRPLYFEEPNLERCGLHCGCAQTAVSAVHFLANTIILPYRLIVRPPCVLEPTLGDCPTCHYYGCDAYELWPVGWQCPAPTSLFAE